MSAFGSQHRLDDAALHQISQVILAQQTVAREQIAHRRILPLHRVGRRHTGQPAELLFRQDFDRLRKLFVQFFGAAQLVALLGRRPEAFGSNHEHRRFGVHLVRCRAAEADDQLTRLPTCERTELSREDDELTGERVILIRRG